MNTEFDSQWCWMPKQPHSHIAYTMNPHNQPTYDNKLPVCMQYVAWCYYNNRVDTVVYNTSSNKPDYPHSNHHHNHWFPAYWPQLATCSSLTFSVAWLVVELASGHCLLPAAFALHCLHCSALGSYAVMHSFFSYLSHYTSQRDNMHAPAV